jgi:hypothetical protein
MNRIMIGAPVRQDEETFVKYLESLKKLNTEGLEVDYFFILHNSKNLEKYLKPDQFYIYESKNEYVKNETHEWSNDNLKDVIFMKNALISKVLRDKYDYFFLVDSDIILHENTLQHLIKQDKSIISEIFWTRWTPEREEEPNAWLYDFYSFDDLDKIKDWRQKGVYEVGGTGACILIKKQVLESSVNYYPIKNISFSLWEDRAFCIRASVAGYKIYVDTHYPAEHLYRR